jgi:tetratricopeptide (TPR) repeat protein
MRTRDRFKHIGTLVALAWWSTAALSATGGPTTIEELQALLTQVEQRTQATDFAGAGELLESALVSPMFERLDASVQHDLVASAAFMHLQADQHERAHELFVRVTAMNDAGGDDWFGRTFAAQFSGKDADAVSSLTMLARKWPASLADMHARFVYGILKDSKELPGQETARVGLLNALFDAEWKPYGLEEPGDTWVELVLASIENGDPKRALEVAKRIDDPESMIRLRADRRFDSITQPLKGQLDVTRAGEAKVKRLRAGAQSTPRSARILTELMTILLELRRPRDVIVIADEALARAARGDKGQPAFDDLDEYGIWIKDSRARALRNLGRHEDAVTQWVEASRELENGNQNVSQAINVGSFYCDLGRPDEALAAVASLTDDDVSPYGAMQLHGVRHCAALRKKDAESARKELEYLAAHKDDDQRTYEISLVDEGRLDAAAQLLIARLQDPKQRSDALLEVQNYARTPGTPIQMEWRARWQELLARSDVRGTIDKVGRIEKYAFERLF